MQRFLLIALIATLVGLAVLNLNQANNRPDPVEEQLDGSEKKSELLEEKMAPAEHFFTARNWPDGKFSIQTWREGLNKAKQDYQNNQASALLRAGGTSWQLEGPTNIGGRINTIAVHPSDHDIIYVGCASGGIFKTTDGGLNWSPIFDDQQFLPIGDIELDPSNPDIVYAGTGDPNVSGYPFIGDGLYKSTDAGLTWTYIGLAETRIISKVRVHPLDPNLLYVGAMGLTFEKDGNRGLYKSTDGGASWNRILLISDSTGVSDLLIDELNTDRIWAAGWDRLRNNSKTIVYGPGAIIRRTLDGGSSWTTLGGGLPTGYQCRIGLDQEPGNPSHIVAQFIGTDLETQGVYESVNGGNSWLSFNVTDLNSSSAMGGFGWYFAKVRFNPFVPGQFWVCGVNLWRTNNAGALWTNMTASGGVHADKHDLVFLSANEALLATDGGLYRTINGGASWTDAESIPNTQFYHAQVNPHLANDYWGGAQDNGTSRGNGLSPDTWQRMFGGDGFHVEFNPDDDQILYAETKNGDIWYSLNGGLSFDWGSFSLPFSDRRNWDMPFIISPHDASRIYAGTYRLHRSDDVIPLFTPVSGDLTRGVLTDPRFHNLTTIRESPVTEGLLYTCSSDGRVNRSNDGGGLWTVVSTALPNRYITDLECSFQNSDVVFVTHSGYKDNDFSALLHYSTNRGNTWTSIAGDLPALAINDMEVYPGNDSILFVANDGGVYFSTNLGSNWSRLGNGMPVVNVYDIELDTRLGKLVAGTHGRSMMSLELADVIPSQLHPELSADLVLCSGESASLEADGALFYEWSPTAGLSCSDCQDPIASPTTTTTYTVSFRDGLGHEETRSVTVTVEPLPPVPVITATGDVLSITGVGGAAYQWYQDGILISDANDPSYMPSEAGIYTVEVFSVNGCSSVSAEFSWLPSGLEPTWISNWSVGPNPMRDEVQLQLPALASTGTYRLRWYDAQGRLLVQERSSGGTTIQPVLNWTPGIYYLRVNAEGGSQTVKLVKW